MTVQEMTNIFGIDITKKNRTDLNVYLRTLYVEKNLPYSSFNKIGKELGYNHATLINCYRKLDEYNKDPLFMYVKKAFKTKNNDLIVEYHSLFKERRLERSRVLNQESYIKRFLLEKPEKEKIIKEEVVIKYDFEKVLKEDILTVANKLRRFKTYLNDKYFNEWNDRDWKKYNELINN